MMIGQIRQEAEFFDKLGALGGMLRLQATIVWLLRALTAGLAVDSATLIVSRFRAFTPTGWLLLALPLLPAVAAIGWALLRRPTNELVAARTDKELSLKERLTTALELQRTNPAGVLARAQIADAMWHAQRIEPWHVFPPRLPRREGAAALAALLIAAALVLIPNPAKSALEQRAAQQAAIKVQAQKLRKTITQIKQNEAQTGNHSADQQNIDSILRQLEQQMTQPSLTADQALAKLQSAQQKLQANQDANAGTLAEALQALAAQFSSQPVLRQTARDVSSGNYSAAARDLRQAGQQASSLSQSQKNGVAASLRAAAAAEAKAGNSKLGDSLNQAADALSGNNSSSKAAFSRAASNLQTAGQRSQAQQNLSKAASQVQQSANALSQMSGQNGKATSANPTSGSGQGSQGSLDPSSQAANSAQPLASGQPGQGNG
ncbi:MAG: hypothetical protein ACYDAG_15470, partial [Chloroflexota bacterium]